MCLSRYFVMVVTVKPECKETPSIPLRYWEEKLKKLYIKKIRKVSQRYRTKNNTHNWPTVWERTALWHVLLVGNDVSLTYVRAWLCVLYMKQSLHYKVTTTFLCGYFRKRNLAPYWPKRYIKKYTADKSLARPGRKQANVSVRMAWNSFGALPCRKKKTWWQLTSPCCWNRARPWHASEVVSFLVGLRTYQHPGTAIGM